MTDKLAEVRRVVEGWVKWIGDLACSCSGCAIYKGAGEQIIAILNRPDERGEGEPEGREHMHLCKPELEYTSKGKLRHYVVCSCWCHREPVPPAPTTGDDGKDIGHTPHTYVQSPRMKGCYLCGLDEHGLPHQAQTHAFVGICEDGWRMDYESPHPLCRAMVPSTEGVLMRCAQPESAPCHGMEE